MQPAVAVISRLLLYVDPILSVSPLDLNNYWEFPNLILLGLMIGVLAISYVLHRRIRALGPTA